MLNRPVRWPRKNDPESIRQRQELLGVGGLVTSIDLEPFTSAAEALSGVAVIPVSACPVEIELGSYVLDEDGTLGETGRDPETVYVPLAHTEGSLTLSMTRGSTAAGTVRTHVLADRITRASCFVCADAAASIALVFSYDVHDVEQFERVYGPEGEWARFFRTGRGYIGTELLRDVEQPGRYFVVDRWETSDAYNRFVEQRREEYMRRVDETAFLYRQELRLGTFENVWTDGHPSAP